MSHRIWAKVRHLLVGLTLTGCFGLAMATEDLNVFTWNNALSPETIARFESECACHVNLTYFGSMEEALAKLAGGAQGFDVICPSNYGIPALIRLGLLRPLDKHAIPNLRNIDPAFLNTPLDPGNVYSLPYDFTITLVGYNATRLHALGLDASSWSLVFDPHMLEKLRGRVTVLDDPREVIAAALRYKGHSGNSTDPAQLREAEAAIRAALPYWAAFNSQSYIRELTVGNIWVVLGYSSDVYQAGLDARNTHRAFSITSSLQREGNGMTADSFVVTKTAPHPALAYRFINFMLRPENAAEITNAIGAGNPNAAARAFIRPDLLADPVITPGAAQRQRLEQLNDLDSGTRRAWNRAWTDLKVGH
ncbi:spermidine/putrescine ABC transporter substrate-binding protein [Cupriavidus metallidurans]|jgi:spermidine/putrescine transport system substrate-binding protein|uniref:Putrescine-binding periplasmic protein n=1 Tax=Cupriavidus metallidurans TaxID=119219 RepID=A0A2L0X3F0_9BURK|nr:MULTISPECIES: spermidine/putrescine ABC transporter substrate-binding protein [Cupriavidus]AVA34595.1 spermidine/putrescine ABC transporter substrate-binding protein [Cupriavidus metallidurans]EKZ95977.1 spermidine\putrescine ABC transporter substrate-binding protein [Cupriavidus sp. HMR-1]KWR82550.1 spermidine/putrescine ABC transporter substrate-binding protein [Cupriavidus sp. SHE]QBP12357.1 spermidine/putrescine ABC transporter substrate-binding protein [Cupriavidus metallidurans]QWC923